MNGRPVLISGCSSGIGRHVALGLKHRGYRVFAGARRATDVDALLDAGLEAVQMDVADSASLQAAVSEILSRTGGQLYGLFNNAGFGQPGAVEDLSRDALREQFEVNVLGLHELTRAVIPAMRRAGRGRIIHNSSILGFMALRYRGAYVASKYAVEGLADTLRLELRGSGIYVSLVEPGPIRSRFRVNALAAFRRHVDAARSVHRGAYAAQAARLGTADREQPFTLGPEAVLRPVIHALESRRPRARYYVTVPTWGFAILKRLLSTAAMDALLSAASGAENRRR